ncbi:UNVERIFIED_ORG: hypothetical protein B2H98_02500 [Clostridium botulinum]
MKNKEEKFTGQKTLGEIFEFINDKRDDTNTRGKMLIPKYQRNYKWNKKLAKILVKDLIKYFNDKKIKSIGMITLYCHNNQVDLIDGQQRMITLYILFSAISKLKDNIIPELIFERDLESNKVRNITIYNKCNSAKNGNTDIDRIIRNYNVINDVITQSLEENKYADFFDYVIENSVMLCNVTEKCPVSEFMNLNALKTRFSICDIIRANLISYNTFHKEDLEREKSKVSSALTEGNYKKSVSKLYDDLVRIFYWKLKENGEFKSVFDVVKGNSKIINNESRINIMFADYKNGDNYIVDADTVLDLNCISMLQWLASYKHLLLELKNEMENKNFSSAKIITHLNKDFFALLPSSKIDSVNDVNNMHSDELARILHMNSSIDRILVEAISPNDEKLSNLFFEAHVDYQKNKKTNESFYHSSVTSGWKKQYAITEEEVNDCIQGCGKYIMYRYAEEQQRSRDAYFRVQAIVNFDDNIVLDEGDESFISGELNVESLFNCDEVIIPIIQRDYCMGSLFMSEGNDFLNYLFNEFTEFSESKQLNESYKLILSAIVVSKTKRINNEKGKLYIFDGQQRTFTIYCILKYLQTYLNSEKESIQLPEYTFEGRESFRKEFSNTEEALSYAEAAVKNCHNILKASLKNWSVEKKNQFNEFIRKYVYFNVQVVKTLDSAEQYFMDINGGVPLENYEIFKSFIIDEVQKKCKDNREALNCWQEKLDNEWLYYFYKFRNTHKIFENNIVDDENNAGEEELMEMRCIEYLCRHYWMCNYKNKSNIENLKNLGEPFDLLNKSDLLKNMVYLLDFTDDDYMEIGQMMDRIINWNLNNQNKKISIIEDYHSYQRSSSRLQLINFGMSYIDCDIKDTSTINNNYFMIRFIYFLSDFIRKKYLGVTILDEEYIEKLNNSELIIEDIRLKKRRADMYDNDWIMFSLICPKKNEHNCIAKMEIYKPGKNEIKGIRFMSPSNHSRLKEWGDIPENSVPYYYLKNATKQSQYFVIDLPERLLNDKQKEKDGDLVVYYVKKGKLFREKNNPGIKYIKYNWYSDNHTYWIEFSNASSDKYIIQSETYSVNRNSKSLYKQDTFYLGNWEWKHRQ